MTGTLSRTAASALTSPIDETISKAEPSASTIDSAPGVETTQPSQSSSNDAQEAETREKISNDLFTWQEKFLKAADKGAVDLGERVQDITDRQIKNQVDGVGNAFVTKLEESVSTEVSNLKKSINEIVKTLPLDSSEKDFEAAESEVSKAVKAAAVGVKSNAQSLRLWKQKFIMETQSLVNAASVSTLDVLDDIRDLGLQEIGMRWAWMDGVTYKDWTKYHDLKKAFDEWRDEVEAVATKHEGLQKSTRAAEELESRGLAIAEEAAKELSRLKEVGLWKVYAQDDSDDFSTRKTPAKVVLAEKLAAKKARELTKVAAESASAAALSAETVLQQFTEGVIGAVSESVVESPQPSLGSAFSAASVKVSGIADDIAETIRERRSSNSESLFSAGTSLVSQVSEKIIGTSQVPSESIIPTTKSQLNDISAGVSSIILGTPTSETSNVLSKVSEVGEDASSSAESVLSGGYSKVFAGAMAHNVAAQVPIFDEALGDDDSYLDRIQELMGMAGAQFAELTDAVSDALAQQTATPGTVEGATSLASEKISSALAAASSAIYGQEPGAAEKLSRVASDRYADAVSA